MPIRIRSAFIIGALALLRSGSVLADDSRCPQTIATATGESPAHIVCWDQEIIDE